MDERGTMDAHVMRWLSMSAEIMFGVRPGKPMITFNQMEPKPTHGSGKPFLDDFLAFGGEPFISKEAEK